MARPANDNKPDALLFVSLGDGTAAVVCCDDINKRYPPPREIPDYVVRRLALALGVAGPQAIGLWARIKSVFR